MEFITAKQVADILNCSTWFVYQNRKILGGIRIGKLVRFNREIFESKMKEVMNRDGLQAQGQMEIGEYVFCHEDGSPYNYRSKFLHNACRKAKVRVFTYHPLRHYGASTLANAGVAITDIQAILGHQRTTTTDIYLQSISPNLKNAMDKLDD